MPIYEYACAACGHQFEEWQKMSDAPVRTCPKCKKKKVERLISRTAFQLKGSGWYADLYSSSKPGQEAKGESKSEASDGSSSSSKESSGSADGSSKGSKSAEKATASDSSSKKKKDSTKKAETRAA
ncbi:MAG TPA: zinc ribbon domain-containing protein [Polyangia bacterium]|jgi:putative FmdB family regulatory protein